MRDGLVIPTNNVGGDRILHETRRKGCPKLTANRLSMPTWSLFCRVCKWQGERRSLRMARKRWTMTPILGGHTYISQSEENVVRLRDRSNRQMYVRRCRFKQSGNRCSVASLGTNKTIHAPSWSSNCCWRTSWMPIERWMQTVYGKNAWKSNAII